MSLPYWTKLTLENCAAVLELAHRFAAPGLIHKAAIFIVDSYPQEEMALNWKSLEVLDVVLKHDMKDIKIHFAKKFFLSFKVLDDEDRAIEDYMEQISAQTDAVQAFILQQYFGVYSNYRFEKLQNDE